MWTPFITSLLMEMMLVYLAKYDGVKEKSVFESLHKIISEEQIYYHKLHTLVQITIHCLYQEPHWNDNNKGKTKTLLCVTVE